MNHCLFCFAPLLGTDTLFHVFVLQPKYTFCATCMDKLVFIREQQEICPRCCKGWSAGVTCPDCKYWEDTIGYVVCQQAIFCYNEFIVNVLWQIKHNRDIHLIRGFYPFICAYVRRTYDLAHTVFVPIPTDRATLRRRRFNLIEFVLQELQLPLNVCPLFSMVDEANVKQHQRGRSERLEASKQRFVCDNALVKVLEEQSWQKIIIVDDVYTTGATVVKAVKSLPQVVQNKVSSFTLFR